MALARDQKAMDWLYGHTTHKALNEGQNSSQPSDSKSGDATKIQEPSETTATATATPIAVEGNDTSETSASSKASSAGSPPTVIEEPRGTDTVAEMNINNGISSMNDKATAWLGGYDAFTISQSEAEVALRESQPPPNMNGRTLFTTLHVPKTRPSVLQNERTVIVKASPPSDVIEPPTNPDTTATAAHPKIKTTAPDEKALAWLSGYDSHPYKHYEIAASVGEQQSSIKQDEPAVSVKEEQSSPVTEPAVSIKEEQSSPIIAPTQASNIPADTTIKAKSNPAAPYKDEKAIAWLCGHEVPTVKREGPTTSVRDSRSSTMKTELTGSVQENRSSRAINSPTKTGITEKSKGRSAIPYRDGKAPTELSSSDAAAIKRDHSTASARESKSPSATESFKKPKTIQTTNATAAARYRDQKAAAWLFGHDVPVVKRKQATTYSNVSNKSPQTEKPASLRKMEESSLTPENGKITLSTSVSDDNSPEVEVPLKLTAESLRQVRTTADFPLIKRKKSHSTWDISTDLTPPDIRHAIGPENHMMQIDGMISRRPYDLVEEDVILNSEAFRNAFIEDWVSNVRTQVIVDMTNAAAFVNRDIDTFTGAYLPPREHPPSKWDEVAYFRSPPLWREHAEMWTSNFLIERETNIREAKERRKNAKNHAKARHTPSPGVDYEIVQTPDPVVPELTPDCILRPANWNDLQGIVEIYNDEVDNGLRAWDTEHVKISDFNKIGAHCSANQLPFIVAVHRHENIKDGRGYLPSPANGKGNTQETVLGFGFLQLLDCGIGVGKNVGRLSAKLTVYVDRLHRKKHIGSAIVDRMLLHMSRGHPGNSIKHKWESVTTHPYNDLEMNRRERLVVNRIIVEGLFKGKRDADWVWFNKMMNGFQFHQVGHVEGAYSTRRGMQSEILDKFIWLHDGQVPEPDGSGLGIGERVAKQETGASC